MFKKMLRYSVVFVALSLFLLLPVHSKAADYQLKRTDTKMTCIETKTGSLVKSRFITYKGYTYYFNQDGFAQTGWLALGKDYYFFDANGAMAKKTWINQYYFQANGKMAVSKWINKNTYVGTDGRVIPGYKRKSKAKFVTDSRGTRYRNYDGTFSAQTWQCIKGKWYYFYSNGYMAKSRRIGRFYVNKRGEMLVNQSIRIGNKKFYFGKDGSLTKTVRLKKK